MLNTDRELYERVDEMTRTFAGLTIVGAIGFSSDRPARVAANMEALATDGRFELLDLRGEPDTEALRALSQVNGRRLLLIANRAHEVAWPLAAWLRAAVDGQSKVRIDPVITLSRFAEQSTLVLCEGASSMNDVADELTRIPYWSFLA